MSRNERNFSPDRQTFHPESADLYKLVRQGRFSKISDASIEALLLTDHSEDNTYRIVIKKISFQGETVLPMFYEVWEDERGRTVQRILISSNNSLSGTLGNGQGNISLRTVTGNIGMTGF